MGDVWIRTINHGLVRADRVTEIAASRGSVHEERGYSIKAVAEGKAYILIDNSDLEGTPNSRFGHASRMQAALLLAVDAASTASAPMVISYEQDGERWVLTPASDIAGEPVPAVPVASGDHAKLSAGRGYPSRSSR
ncbi:hypothetical protein [Arthrobacter sp. NPDC056493]|uniref:hypothetical protein n=1 Tax=Arthrobacter sp. NPDC056493 TaxID=3345839 RepID=UPI003670E1F5